MIVTPEVIDYAIKQIIDCGASFGGDPPQELQWKVHELQLEKEKMQKLAYFIEYPSDSQFEQEIKNFLKEI